MNKLPTTAMTEEIMALPGYAEFCRDLWEYFNLNLKASGAHKGFYISGFYVYATASKVRIVGSYGDLHGDYSLDNCWLSSCGRSFFKNSIDCVQGDARFEFIAKVMAVFHLPENFDVELPFKFNLGLRGMDYYPGKIDTELYLRWKANHPHRKRFLFSRGVTLVFTTPQCRYMSTTGFRSF